jgi:type IV pilus assembly protein PilC
MKYIYQARDKQGKIETGTVEAPSREAAVLLLQKYNIFVTSIKEQDSLLTRAKNIRFFDKVSKKDLSIFSRQLAVMLQSRVSITQALKGLTLQTKNQSFREKILKIAQMVEGGSPLSEAVSKFPEVFNNFYVSLIRAGEASGRISESLAYLADHLEREYDMQSQITGALIYPAFVLIALVVIIPLVIIFVMPKIVDLLKEATTNPPLFTRMMINFYSFLENYGWILVLGFFVLIVFGIVYLRSKEGKKVFDEFSLKAPILGEIFKKIFLARFAENISTLIAAGIAIGNAIKISADTVENSVYKNIFSKVQEGVLQGEKMSVVLSRYPDFAPAFVIQMIQVGEETGTLDKNLLEIVNFYNKEIKRAIAAFTALLEPALIMILGLGVAFLAVSVIQPMYGALGTI